MRNFAFLTNQSWKYRVSQGLTAAALLMTMAETSLWVGNPLQLPLGPTVLVFFAVCIPWFLWWAFAVKCPNCGKSPSWYHMTHGPARNAEDRIEGSVICPWCEFNPLDILDQSEGDSIE